jgi:hypothetical protein
VKLQKLLNRRVAGKDYSKWVVTIPPAKVQALGWREGEDLVAEVRGKTLLLRPSVTTDAPRTGRASS